MFKLKIWPTHLELRFDERLENPPLGDPSRRPVGQAHRNPSNNPDTRHHLHNSVRRQYFAILRVLSNLMPCEDNQMRVCARLCTVVYRRRASTRLTRSLTFRAVYIWWRAQLRGRPSFCDQNRNDEQRYGRRSVYMSRARHRFTATNGKASQLFI